MAKRPKECNTCTVLGSNKLDFLIVMLVKLSMHVGLLIYAPDMVFTGHCMRLVWGLCSSWLLC
jgi:hypothetical protein